MPAYTVNVVGEDVLDYDIPVGSTPERIGASRVLACYGDYDGATVICAAPDEDAAASLVLAAFDGEVTIDDLDVCADQQSALDLLKEIVVG